MWWHHISMFCLSKLEKEFSNIKNLTEPSEDIKLRIEELSIEQWKAMNDLENGQIKWWEVQSYYVLEKLKEFYPKYVEYEHPTLDMRWKLEELHFDENIELQKYQT